MLQATLRFLPAGLLLFAIGCGGDECLPKLDLDCTPQYAPTFSNIHANTFARSCATTSACHAGDGAQAGLRLSDPDEAHRLLTDAERGPLARARDPSCSPLIQRIESTDPGFMMPPGRMLSEPERCAIRRWVQAGAQR